MQDKRVNRTMLAFDVSRELRDIVKIHAIKRHMTVRDWIVAVIIEAIRKENEYNQ